MPAHLKTTVAAAALVAAYGFSAVPVQARSSGPRTHHPVGLGKVLTSKDGGQIYGFDINQHGDDGLLATAQDVDIDHVLVSVETFDQNTGKIAKSFAKHLDNRNSYTADAIFAGDVGLVTHFIVPDGSVSAREKYAVLSPVTAQGFTGAWTPPVKHLRADQFAENQDTPDSLILAWPNEGRPNPRLLLTDVANNTFSKVIALPNDLLPCCGGEYMGQYTAGNMAVFAFSPDGGAVGGDPPVNVLVDLSSGKITQFNGYNNGFFHAGDVNGLAVDPNTGVAATTTELNAQVEFYDLNKKTGITFVQLPCTQDGDQLNSGTTIANDPVNKLFLVTDIDYCDGSQGAAIVVYDEKGNLVETITGFNPAIQFAIIQPPPRLNPGKRMGWAFGGPAGVSQLQQFFY